MSFAPLGPVASGLFRFTAECSLTHDVASEMLHPDRHGFRSTFAGAAWTAAFLGGG